MTALSVHTLPRIIDARSVTMLERVLLALLVRDLMTVSEDIFFVISQLRMPAAGILADANHGKVTSAEHVAVSELHYIEDCQVVKGRRAPDKRRRVPSRQ
jgi:hypothetical protein